MKKTTHTSPKKQTKEKLKNEELEYEHNAYKLAMIKIISSAIDTFTLRLGGENAEEVIKRLAIIEGCSVKVMTESFATNPHITFAPATAAPVNTSVELSEAEVITKR